MNRLLSLLSLLLLSSIEVLAASGSGSETDADKLVEQKSYQKALEIYQKITPSSPEHQRALTFKIADSQWRAEAGSSNRDDTKIQNALRPLSEIAEKEPHDKIWAQANESIGDFHWTRSESRNWGAGWPYYQKALDYWAGQSDLETARQRYLHIIWSATEEKENYYSWYGNYLPVEVLDNAVTIAKTDEDKARAHYLLAMSLKSQGGDPRQMQRVQAEFEAALKLGKKNNWYDDALFNYAQHLEYQGKLVFKNGYPQWEPDLIEALKFYQRITNEFKKGETRYYDNAKERIKEISSPAINLYIPYIFLPDSDIQVNINWRNVKEISLALYPVHLLNNFPEKITNNNDDVYLKYLESQAGKALKKWTKNTEDDGRHQQHSDTLKIDSLPAGAYLLTASSGGVKARQLLLVTSIAMTAKTTPTQILFFACDALTGHPLANAQIKVNYRYYDGQDSKEHWEQLSGASGENGIWIAKPRKEYRDLFAVAALENKQAFVTTYSNFHRQQNEPYKIYAFTDRPAYRPNEKVEWKAIVRGYDGKTYVPPQNEWVRYEIFDPLGNKIKEDQNPVSEFGTLNNSLTLDEKAPLGEYRINFHEWNAAKKITERFIGSATLFRLEEYKLPEFKISISTKEKTYRIGEKVTVELSADYYFGGPAAKAKVEYLVYQAPFHQFYYPPCDYPWYYKDRIQGWRQYEGHGQIVERGQAETDVNGKAKFSFQTPTGSAQDFQYTIEARVTDSSRREITASQVIKVTRQSYYVHLRPQQYVYQPQDTVKVDLKSLDANEGPVSVAGRLTVYRDYWETRYEEDKNEPQATDKNKSRFPPSETSYHGGEIAPNQQQRKIIFQGYRNEKISTESIKTNEKGEATFSFKPEREGYYRLQWISEDKDHVPINSQTTVFVCTKRSRDIGYRYGGIQIVPDRETYHAGETARIMLVAPSHDSCAVFSVDGDDLYSYEVIHFDGAVKLIELPIKDLHQPNVFLNAFLVKDAQIFIDQKEIIVPPVEKFLKITIQHPKEKYEPREEAEVTLTVQDHLNKPVKAELALGLVDESVYYIQQDYAGDIREFFYGQKRSPSMQTQSTFQMRPYQKGKWDDDKKQFIIDEIIFGRRDRDMRGIKSKSGFAEGLDYLTESEEAIGSGEMDDKSTVFGYARGGLMSKNAPAAPRLSEMSEKKMEVGRELRKESPDAAQGQSQNVIVRSDFRSTVLWAPILKTDENGRVKVKIKYPDSLTGWKTTVRAISTGTDVGMSDAATRTKKDMLVRLETPRFLVEHDTATLSGIVHNYTDKPLSLEVTLKAENLKLLDKPTRKIKVKANDEQRVDWRAEVEKIGQSKIVLSASSAKNSDAMERILPIYEHGIEKFIAESGWSNPDQQELAFELNIPKERNPNGTSLEVILAPSIAVTCLDALPYLADYPYGCVEQTMSRFLPAAIVAKTLEDLNISKKAIENRLFGGIEQEFVDKTHPKVKKDLGKLNKMIRDGLNRLQDMQHADGGWGWWKEGDSDHFMTAYIVQGLILADQAGVSVPGSMTRRGLDFLGKEIVEEELDYDMQAWMAYALALGKKHQNVSLNNSVNKQFDNLWNHRDKLNAYTRSLLALAFHYAGDPAKAKTLVENLENGIRADETAQTAHWGEDGIHYRWSEGGVEATSWALKAMLAVDPQNKRIAQAMNWLVKNRRGAQWSNTRNTAMVVLALTDYLRQSKELAQDFEYELLVNGKSVAKQKITPQTALDARSRFNIPEKLLKEGANRIQIKKTGQAKLYHSAYLKYFTKEEPVTAAGNEIFIKREYFRYAGRQTLLKGYVYDKIPLEDGGMVKSGERIEVKLTIETKNNYEYLVFEDLKPAGIEAVQIRSGEPLYASKIKAEKYRKEKKEEATGHRSSAHQELRDRKVALFLSKLPEGFHTITYDLRAEAPGEFHALPVLGHAMYVPEIRANSDEIRMKVVD